jgi:endonuclease-3
MKVMRRVKMPVTLPRGSVRRIRALNARLETAYGRQPCPGKDSPLDELIATILSQNTNDRNSGEGFRRLKARFPRWEDALAAPVRSLASAIRVSGLANVKSRRIKNILRQIRRERGKLSLDFLHDAPVAEAREYLKRFKGVGQKTIACVLCFACRKPVFPVDTHVLRVSKRLWLVPGKADADKAHERLQGLVPSELTYSFHVLLIFHGRRTCHARNPECGRCAVRTFCGWLKSRCLSP